MNRITIESENLDDLHNLLAVLAGVKAIKIPAETHNPVKQTEEKEVKQILKSHFSQFGNFPFDWEVRVDELVKQHIGFTLRSVLGKDFKQNSHQVNLFVKWLKSRDDIETSTDENSKLHKKPLVFLPRYWKNKAWRVASLPKDPKTWEPIKGASKTKTPRILQEALDDEY